MVRDVGLFVQAKAFLNYFHMERTKQLTMLIDNEQWTQADVPIDFQQMVDKITKSRHVVAVGAAAGNENAHMADLDLVSSMIDKSKDDDEPAERSSQPNMQAYLMLDRKPYHVVLCCLLFVKMLDEYVSCAVSMPSLAPDVLNRLIEITKVCCR